MRYLEFEVKNYKGINSVKLDLARHPTSPAITLVGLNESGKTTILEAISAFTPGSTDVATLEPYGYARPDPHDLIPISARSNFNGQITVTAKVRLDDADVDAVTKALKAKHDFRISGKFPREIKVMDAWTFESSRYTKKNRLWWLTFSGRSGKQRKDRQPSASSPEWVFAANTIAERMPRVWYFPNFLFEFPDKIYLNEPPGATQRQKDRNNFFLDLIQDILDDLALDANVKEHLHDRAISSDTNDARALRGILLEMSRLLTKQVFSAWHEIFDRRIAGKRIKLEVDRSEEGEPYIFVQIEDADGFYQVSERSLGFRWFFVFLLITNFVSKKSGSDRSTLLLLDEPASNLHPTAQSQLLKSFERLSSQCTLIYATHSHHLINPLWLDATIVVRNEGVNYEDEVTAGLAPRATSIEAVRYREFVARQPDQTTYFQPILDVLQYRPSRLESVPAVVMVEGKTDFYLLQYLLTVCMPSDITINLLPGGGAGSLDTAIQLYAAWGRPFVALLDSDAEGTKQKQRYLEKFGPMLEGRVFCLSDINGGWKKSVESFLPEADQQAIQAAVFPDGQRLQKKLLHRAVCELLATKRSIPVSQEARSNTEALRSFLAAALKGGAGHVA